MCIKVISVTPIILVYRYTKMSIEEPVVWHLLPPHIHIHTHSHNSRKLLSVWKSLLRFYSHEEWLYFCDCPTSELSMMYECHPLMNSVQRSRERWLEMFNWPGQPTLQHRAMLHLCRLSPSFRQLLVQWFLWEINLTSNIKERQTAFWSLKHFCLQISVLNPHTTTVCV